MLGEHVDELAAVAVEKLVLIQGGVLGPEDLSAERQILPADLEIKPDTPSLLQQQGRAEIDAAGADVDNGGGDAGLRNPGSVSGLIDGVKHDGGSQRDFHILAALFLVQLLQDLAPQGAKLTARQRQGGGQAATAGDPAQYRIIKYYPVKGVGLIGSGPGDNQKDLAGMPNADPGLADQSARFLNDIPFFALFKHRQIKSPVILRRR